MTTHGYSGEGRETVPVISAFVYGDAESASCDASQGHEHRLHLSYR